MARTNVRMVRAHNALLEICDARAIGDQLPSEIALSEELGVSRTVIRNALSRMHLHGIITLDGRTKLVRRRTVSADVMEGPPVLLDIDDLEKRFFDWLLRMDVPRGTTLNVAQMAKDFEVAAHTLQEFLTSLSRFGIVKRRPKGGWVLEGFTIDFALELSDFRTLLELNAVRQVVDLPADHPVWMRLEALKAEHVDLLSRVEQDFHDFSELDERFHTAINAVVTNRFVTEFQKLISLIFHYHFQWNKSDERVRNECAIHEHLIYIDALLSRDAERAVAAARNHLATSKVTLVNSIKAHAHDQVVTKASAASDKSSAAASRLR